MYTQAALADSTYEGWVAWIDGHPVTLPDGTLTGYANSTALFERVPHNTGLLQVIGSKGEVTREANRQTIDWKDLPHERVKLLELYAFRNVYENQPILSILAQIESRNRWIQLKRRSVIASAGVKDRHAENAGGQSRTGVSSWVMGYWHWDGLQGRAEVWEFNANGTRAPNLAYEGRNHPCWPRPLGFGYAPHVLGLTPADVPEAPAMMTM